MRVQSTLPPLTQWAKVVGSYPGATVSALEADVRPIWGTSAGDLEGSHESVNIVGRYPV